MQHLPVPPSIIPSQTSQMAEADEHANLTVQCRASGHPKPTVSWRREDGAPIKLNGNHELSATPIAKNVDNLDIAENAKDTGVSEKSGVLKSSKCAIYLEYYSIIAKRVLIGKCL